MIPPSISKLVNDSRSFFSDRGELARSFRVRLHRALNDIPFGRNRNVTCFVALEVMCSKLAADSIFDPRLDGLKQDLLAKSISVLDDVGKVAFLNIDRYETYLNDLIASSTNGDMRAAYCGFSIWSAARKIGTSSTIQDEDELHIEPTEWDASFLASIALCGSATWENRPADDKERERFWKWYLGTGLEKCWS